MLRVRPCSFLLIITMLSPALTQAQSLPSPSRTMYKCTVQGTTTYSDSPCIGATKLEVEPTRGASKLTGRERIGQDVFNERQHEVFADGIRPLTGMNAKQLTTFTRRQQLATSARQECATLDQSIPAAEFEERQAVPAELRSVQERLYQMRQRSKELRC